MTTSVILGNNELTITFEIVNGDIQGTLNIAAGTTISALYLDFSSGFNPSRLSVVDNDGASTKGVKDITRFQQNRISRVNNDSSTNMEGLSPFDWGSSFFRGTSGSLKLTFDLDGTGVTAQEFLSSLTRVGARIDTGVQKVESAIPRLEVFFNSDLKGYEALLAGIQPTNQDYWVVGEINSNQITVKNAGATVFNGATVVVNSSPRVTYNPNTFQGVGTVNVSPSGVITWVIPSSITINPGDSYTLSIEGALDSSIAWNNSNQIDLDITTGGTFSQGSDSSNTLPMGLNLEGFYRYLTIGGTSSNALFSGAAVNVTGPSPVNSDFGKVESAISVISGSYSTNFVEQDLASAGVLIGQNGNGIVFLEDELPAVEGSRTTSPRGTGGFSPFRALNFTIEEFGFDGDITDFSTPSVGVVTLSGSDGDVITGGTALFGGSGSTLELRSNGLWYSPDNGINGVPTLNAALTLLGNTPVIMDLRQASNGQVISFTQNLGSNIIAIWIDNSPSAKTIRLKGGNGTQLVGPIQTIGGKEDVLFLELTNSSFENVSHSIASQTRIDTLTGNGAGETQSWLLPEGIELGEVNLTNTPGLAISDVQNFGRGGNSNTLKLLYGVQDNPLVAGSPVGSITFRKSGNDFQYRYNGNGFQGAWDTVIGADQVIFAGSPTPIPIGNLI